MPKMRTLAIWALIGAMASGVVVAIFFWTNAESGHPALPARPDLSNHSSALQQMISEAESAVSERPDSGERWQRLGALYHANGFWNEATACYEMCLDGDRQSAAKGYYYLADLGFASGSREAAMVHLQKAVRLVPSYLPARLRLADAYFKLGDPDAAAGTYSAALALDADSPEALFGMARILVDRDKLDVARELLERIDRSGERHLSGLSLLARVLDRQGEAKQAAAVRNRLSSIKDAPMVDPWMEEVAVYCCDEQTLGFRFEDAFNSGRATLAFGYLDRMQELFPDRWLSYYYRGYALRATGRGSMAAFYLRKAASLGGDAAKVYPELVETLIAAGQFAEAEVAGIRGLKLAPNLPQLCVALGKVAQEQHDIAEAKHWYTRALHLDPLNVESNKALAEIHWKAGANARAVEHLERLVLLSPSDWAARAFLAQIHLQENRATPALKLLKEALVHQPEDKELLRLASLASLRIGNDFARAGSFAEAIASYERTLSWDPANVEALANKAQVQAAKRLLQGDMQNVPETATLQTATHHPLQTKQNL